jgi:hypothetical protein
MFATSNKNIFSNALLSINASGFAAIYIATGTSEIPSFENMFIFFDKNNHEKITPIIKESSLYKDVERISLNVIDVLIAALILNASDIAIISAMDNIILFLLFVVANKKTDITIGKEK